MNILLRYFKLLALGLLCTLSTVHAKDLGTPAPKTANPQVLDLAGNWHFLLEGPQPSFPQAAQAPALTFSDTIELPGTTETRGKGPVNTGTELGGLTRYRKYDGPAWYQRNFQIPASWTGKRMALELERTKYTQVWLDGKALGTGTLYTAEQYFELPEGLAAGTHTLLIMVDNRAARRPVHAEAHQFSDNTQTNWNGILGCIRLHASPLVWVDDLRVFPSFKDRNFTLKAQIHNRTGAPVKAHLSVMATSFNHPGATQCPPPVEADLQAAAEATEVTLILPLGEKALAWDEFSPALYALTATLSSASGIHTFNTEAGLRDFSTRNSQFTINGRTTFLRGKHDGCVFPLTGHPPMDTEGWLRYLGTCRDYGINHLRCHTWVPPKAAFAAADRLGIYLQPELPFWGTFTEAVRDFLTPEGEATLRAYGNHPSFVMLTLGNEIGGDRELMNTLVCRLRAQDPRHLYADGSNNVLWDPRLQPTNDFWASAKAINPASDNKQIPARGSFCVFDGNEGHVQWGHADTRTDLSRAIAGLPVPFVGHETGQWTTYPDFKEITKYTGVTRARNLERFQKSLEEQGMSEQDADFHRASGALAADLYKEENELFLRTPGMAGFQLLDLQDFPGQGTALVGVLDAFMDSKGITTPERYRRSCDDLVLLARFDKYTWTNKEHYQADLQLAHFAATDLVGATLSWSIQDPTGKTIAEQTLPPRDIAQGGLRALCSVKADLSTVNTPTRLDLKLRLAIPAPTTSAPARLVTNSWPLWVYPANTSPAEPETGARVALVRSYNSDTKKLLATGARVLLVPDSKNWADTLPGAYATDYWCWPMFNNTPGTMGLLIKPAHPALAAFPSSEHSERQWSALAHASTPVILTGRPFAKALSPIVQVIDNLERNEKLGLVFELRVGAGSLLVCGIDLLSLSEQPEARQLLASLRAYAASADFNPALTIEPGELDPVLRPNLARGAPIQASSFFQPPWGAVPSPERAIDGDINTRWIAAESDSKPALTIDLGSIHTVDTIQLVWENNDAGYTWTAEGSVDGQQWFPLCDQSAAGASAQGGRHLASFAPAQSKHLRLTATGFPAGRRFCLRELRLLGE